MRGRLQDTDMRSDPVPVTRLTNRNHRLLFSWFSVNDKVLGDFFFYVGLYLPYKILLVETFAKTSPLTLS